MGLVLLMHCGCIALECSKVLCEKDMVQGQWAYIQEQLNCRMYTNVGRYHVFSLHVCM